MNIDEKIALITDLWKNTPNQSFTDLLKELKPEKYSNDIEFFNEVAFNYSSLQLYSRLGERTPSLDAAFMFHIDDTLTADKNYYQGAVTLHRLAKTQKTQMGCPVEDLLEFPQGWYYWNEWDSQYYYLDSDVINILRKEAK